MADQTSSHPRADVVAAAPRRMVLGVGLMVAGLLGSFGLFWAVRQAEHLAVRTEFEQRAQNVVHFLKDELQRHQDMLFALRALFHYSDDVTREEFSAAARDLMSRQTGARSLEWVQRVPGGERVAFERAVRAEGFPKFEFSERVSGNTLRSAPPRPEYFPVVFIEPIAGNELALGFDLQSGITWPVMQAIAESGELAASGRLPLLTTGSESDWGYIMELAVYSDPLTATTRERRRSQLRGYVLGIFHISQTLESFFEGTTPDNDILEILFLDRSAREERQFLHYHSRGSRIVHGHEAPTIAHFEAGMNRRVSINHAGRKWELWLRPRKEWLHTHSHMRSWLTLALGLVVTGASTAFIFGALRRERVVGRLVAERTAELQAAQAALERDIQDRRETERQLATMISQLPGAAFRCVFNEKLTALFASDGMRELTGYAADDFTSGRVHISELTVDEDRATARATVGAAVQARRAFECEYRIRDRAGAIRWLLVRGRPIYANDASLRFIEGLAIDVTPLKSAEASKLDFERKLLETQKLESLGVLAGGIAHDFNNLLTAMLGNATLARYTMTAGNPAAEHLDNIEQAARRAADLCQQMLAYAGKKELRAQPMDLTERVRSTATLLRVSIHKNTRLELRLDDYLPAVLADAAQLQQIIMNLVINAADAIGEKPGVITITTFHRQADSAYLRTALHRPELPAGTYVGLEVSDNGCGMTPETLARIFEPFFTTKFSGRGLGLAAVVGIVQSHRGALFVESEVGRGSTFRLLLQAQPVVVPPAPMVSAPNSRSLQGTVLVVDDEDAVRDVLATALRRSGLRPVLAASGKEALRLYADCGNDLDLVMLDLTMPGLSGEETLRAIRQRNPSQHVIVMSGYSEQDTMRRCAALGVTDFIAKPFELSVLEEKLQAVAVAS